MLILATGPPSRNESRSFQTRRVWAGRLINKRKDGTLFEAEASTSPILDASGRLTNYVAVKRDVSRELQLQAPVRRSQKMERTEELAGGLAHEFNNILTAIVLHLDLLQQSAGAVPGMRDWPTELASNAQRAAKLRQQLLLFSRRSVMQIQVLNANQVVENLLKMLRRIIGEYVSLEWLPKPGLAVVSADPGMLEQVVMNLLVNARDAMPIEGRMRLSTQDVEIAEADALRHPDGRIDRFVCLAVSDTW